MESKSRMRTTSTCGSNNERNRQLRGKTADKFPTNQKSQLGISTGNWRQ